MYILIFSATFVWNISHSKNNWERYDHKCTLIFLWSTRYSFPILTELELSLWIFERYWNIKFYENASSKSRVFPCGRTDMTKLIVAFCNFEKAPKKFQLHFCLYVHNFWPTTRLNSESQTPYILVVAAVLPQWKTSTEISWAVMVKFRNVVEKADTISRCTVTIFEMGIMSGN